MKPVSIEPNVAHGDEVEAWRRSELARLFPELTADQVDELACGSNRELLAQANRLARDGCPAAVAYRILRD